MNDTEHDILSRYEAIALASARMLEAARAGEWDDLLAAESECAHRIEALHQLDTDAPMSEAARKRRVELLRRILADDAEVRALTQPWLATLEQFLNGRDTQRRLQSTYR